MPSLDSLPGDQRAVLQLVLGRGRSYDEIARLLSIDRSAVRGRALAAARTVGPGTAVSDERLALIADYLLGQLDDTERDDARRVLADSAVDREWARALAAELAPLATAPLPEIPASGPAKPAPSPAPHDAEPAPAPAPQAASPPPGEAPPPPAAKRRRGRRQAPAPAGDGPRSSRLGGLVLIVVAIAAIVVIVVLILHHSNGSQPVASTPSTSSTAATTAATTAGSSTSSATTTTSASTSSTTTAKPLAAINLSPPPGNHSKALAVAEVLREGSAVGIAIVAQHVPPNKTHPPDAYAVWLYNSPKDADNLGFVNPSVGSSGRFSTATTLPANASHYKQVIVTVETSAKPKTPGPIILQGPLTGL